MTRWSPSEQWSVFDEVSSFAACDLVSTIFHFRAEEEAVDAPRRNRDLPSAAWNVSNGYHAPTFSARTRHGHSSRHVSQRLES